MELRIFILVCGYVILSLLILLLRWPSFAHWANLPNISLRLHLGDMRAASDSRVAWFFLAQWYLFNQVSAAEDRFLFESFDSSKVNPLGRVWVVEEMMLLSLSE